MTAEQILTQAFALLNYTDGEGNPRIQGSHRVRARSLFLINQIYRELWHTDHDTAFVPLVRLNETVFLSDRAMEAFPYGVATLLAQGEGDGDGYVLFSTLYMQKRAALTSVETRQDVLPSVEG